MRKYILMILIVVMLAGCSTMTRIACYGHKTGQECVYSWIDSYIMTTGPVK
jgi:uncharacterized protein YcfL